MPNDSHTPQGAPPLVSVLLTTRDRRQVLLDCLDTLAAQTWPNLEVIVADNASTDGTVEAVRQAHPEVKVVAATENRGIAGGRNLAEAQAQGEYLLFLDSDTLVDPDCVTRLVEFLQATPGAGIAVPKMYYENPPGHVWFRGSTVSLVSSRTINTDVNLPDDPADTEPRPCAHGPTAFMATRDCARAVGGHDERYFMTYADMDYAVTAKRLGFDVYYVPGASLVHKLDMFENTKGLRQLGYNVPLRAYYFSRNRVLFMRKNASRPAFLLFMLLWFPLYTAYYSLKIFQFKGKAVHHRNHLIGSWDGLVHALTGKSRNDKFTV